MKCLNLWCNIYDFHETFYNFLRIIQVYFDGCYESNLRARVCLYCDAITDRRISKELRLLNGF